MKIEIRPKMAESAKNPMKKYISGEKYPAGVSPAIILIALTTEKPIV
jgi:hypothetical protein